jgi:hypothetical protein
MKNQVAELSILVAERILKDKLGDPAAQKALVDKVMKPKPTCASHERSPGRIPLRPLADGTCPGAG